jgi:hypothetical protein
VIFVLLLFKVFPFAWQLNLLLLGQHRSQTPKHRDRVPAILEERAMPMITYARMCFQALPSTALIFFILRFTLQTLLVLVFVLLEERKGSRPLISYVPYLLFRDVFFFPFLGPIAGISPLFPFIATWHRPRHIDAKCKIQLSSSRSVTTLYHVDTWERLGIDLHSVLSQDQSALLNSRLDLSTEFFAVVGVVGERMMPFAERPPL